MNSKEIINIKKSFNYEKLFIKVLIIKLIVLSTLYFVGMEYLVRKYVLKNDHDYKRSLIFKNSKTQNTIWGDSGTMTAINNLEDFNNFSSGSQNFQEIELKIKKYYSNKTGGGKVILQLPINGFAPYRDRKTSDAVYELYLRDSNINFYMSYNYFRKRSYEYFKNFLKNNFKIKLSSNDLFNRDGSVSYLNRYKPLKDLYLKNNLVKKKDKYIPKLNFKNDKNKKALSRIIKFIQSSNMELCLISTPWHQDYFKFRSDIKKFQPIRNYYKYLSKSSNYPYFDFTEINYPSNFHSDISHLSFEGAKAFTNLISNKCFKNLDNQKLIDY